MNKEIFRRYGCDAYYKIVRALPRYDTPEFRNYVLDYNRACCGSMHIGDISEEEITRLLDEFNKRKPISN